MVQTVVVLGGGVAGLSAAHELIERGFEVEVYEALSIPGGQARNVAIGSSGNPGPIGTRKDLPDEHGLRFFARVRRSFGQPLRPSRRPRLRRPCHAHASVVGGLLLVATLCRAQSHRHPCGSRMATQFPHRFGILHP